MNQEKTEPAISFSGRLHDRNFAGMLREARDRQLTGKISVKAREGFATILMRQGKIVSASSPALADKLGELLV